MNRFQKSTKAKKKATSKTSYIGVPLNAPLHAKNRQKLRIIAGHWRGRKLPIADVDGLRPTTDRIRETVFNWLAPNLPGAKVLDLFAGTGALGLEALSRDADWVDMVELSPLASAQLRANLTLLPLQEQQQAQVHNISCFDWLQQHQGTNSEQDIKYDLVFLDPPFALVLVKDTLGKLAQANLLADHALIYIEQPTPLKDLPLPANWQIHKQKKAGQVYHGLVRVGV